MTILLYAVDWKKLPILTPNSKSCHSFHWCDVVLCCTFKDRSNIFSCQLWQSKSLWCWIFTAVSLFSPSNVGLWISSGITEQDQPTSFYNLISWWGMVNIRGDCRNKTSNTMIMGKKNYTKITGTKCLNQVQCASHYLQHVQVPCSNPIENL